MTFKCGYVSHNSTSGWPKTFQGMESKSLSRETEDQSERNFNIKPTNSLLEVAMQLTKVRTKFLYSKGEARNKLGAAKNENYLHKPQNSNTTVEAGRAFTLSIYYGYV